MTHYWCFPFNYYRRHDHEHLAHGEKKSGKQRFNYDQQIWENCREVDVVGSVHIDVVGCSYHDGNIAKRHCENI
jgi:hypothetical protein